MVRTIVAVIASYATMFILDFIGFVTLYAIVGPNQAFKPRIWLAANRWILMTFVMAVIIAIIGGLVCASIAKSRRAPLALAVLIVVVGWTMAIFEIKKHRANENVPRPVVVSWSDAAQKSFWPDWVPFTFPVIGAVGALIGGRLKQRS